jgi:DNA-binding PadR family transcriptional regulator
MARSAEGFLPLKSDVLLMLMSLAEQPRHGYAIIRDVEARTEGRIQLQTGALYRTLRRLLRQRLIEECARPAGEASDDQRRRYYRTSALGDTVLRAELDRLAQLVRAARVSTVPLRRGRSG